PLPDDASPTTLSPGYVAESDPEEDPEEDAAKYPDKEDEEEEEHLAPADFTALHVVDPVSSAEDTELKVASPSTHHPSEIPSPPLLLPSTTHKDDLLEADMPLQKRACFFAPASRFEVGESSAAATTRQAGHAMTSSVDYGFIDTMDVSICASESRVMITVGVVNEKVTHLATTQRQETHELQVRCEDAQYERALLRAPVSLLTRERGYFSSMAS
ncbi:hypothetical protein Tco_0734250, partial [Tanacetum coccineum]